MTAAPLILFGAFDRHNLGDLLLAHMAAAEHGTRPVVFAGLAARDLTSFGGHRVEAMADVMDSWPSRYPAGPMDVLHVGGEILTCSAFEAAVMLLSPREAATTIARYDADRTAAARWAQTVLRTASSAPYVLRKSAVPRPGRIEFRAVGGFDLASRVGELREEVATSLRDADSLTVRDRATRDTLARAGIRAGLEPDPVSRIAERFGERVRQRWNHGELEAVRALGRGGYLALQFAGSIGDDATLGRMAQFLRRDRSGDASPLVMFRAGAAPWHDDIEAYRRLGARLDRPALVFESLDVWSICALIAHARRVLSTSLHAAIVAGAFGVTHEPPPLPPRHPDLEKQRAYFDTWPGGGA